VGPPLAGVLIGLVGATAVLWIDAATFAVSALAVGLGVPARLGRQHAAASAEADLNAAEVGGTVAQLRAGAVFVWRNALLRILILTVAFTNLVDAPFGVALAVYVRDLLGRPEALGLLFAAHGGCAVAGALAYGAFGHRLPRRPTYAAAFLVVALSFGLLAATPTFPIAMLAMALTGAAAGPINPILMTVLQEEVPARMRGRVFGAVRAIALSAMPVGVLAGSALIEAAGTGPTFAAAAAGYLIAGVFLALAPALRRMNRPFATATS
jgi:MFS family permease